VHCLLAQPASAVALAKIASYGTKPSVAALDAFLVCDTCSVGGKWQLLQLQPEGS
jgi:hypothetical protein